MGKAEVIVNRRYSVDDTYTIVENVLRVPSGGFKDGYKAAIVLLDTRISKPRLLIDNTDHPHEFHMHTALPDNKREKVDIGTFDYLEALEMFYDEVKRIINES